MSDLFKLSRMLKESYSPDIVKASINITYLSECLNILRSNDERVFEETSKLYSSVMEADSRRAENAKFADFFKEYQSIIDDYILKIEALASEFSINVETFADANKDILDDNSNANIVSTTMYKGAKYAHLTDPEVPDIDPYKAFKKEFAFIGKLMQDLGPVGSEDQKAQIIATVCNTLSKEINDGWLEKIVEKITDCNDCGRDGYARAIYKTFVPEPSVEMSIDIGLVKQSKLDISNYKAYVDSVSKSVELFTDGLSKVAAEIGSMFFRNQDHKLPIKTDVDGVEDKTYRLNDYSFNQMNMFISTKTTQITELCNLYMVAMGIKMDCIIKYLHQCKDIIDTAVHGVDNTPNTGGVDPGDEVTDNDGTPDSDIPEQEDDDIQDFRVSDDDESEDSEKDVVQDNSDTEIEQECYLFEAIIFEKERAINKYSQKKAVYEALVNEADAQTVKNTIQDKANNVGSFIDSIVNQIKTLMQKMKDALTKNYAPVIKSVYDNQERIKNITIPDGWTIDVIDDSKLDSVKLANFDINDISDMSDKRKYYIKKYKFLQESSIDQNATSAKDMVLASIKDRENQKYDKDKLKDSVDFIIERYNNHAKDIETMANSLPTQKNAAQRAATTESALDLNGTMKMYFEADTAEVPKDQQKATNKADAAKTYFRLNSEMITALMNINSMLMKKHLNFVTKAANIAGVSINNPTLGKNKNTETQNIGNDNEDK